MAVTTEPKMYLNGKIVDYADCKIHAFASVVKYGTGVFEGLRGYWNEENKQLYIFRLREHMERLRFGLKAMRYADIPPQEELERAIIEVSRANNIRATTHYRLIAFLDGDDELSTVGPTGVVAGAVVRGSSPRVENGMAAMISSYVRINDNALPPRVKCTANYVNNRAAELEAKSGGYDGALMLTQEGKLSEASGACCFIVRNGKLITPDLSSDILESITRETVIELARTQLGLVGRGAPHRSQRTDRRGRDVRLRLGLGSRADHVGRPHRRRRRQARRDHARRAEELFRRGARPHQPARGLADAGVVTLGAAPSPSRAPGEGRGRVQLTRASSAPRSGGRGPAGRCRHAVRCAGDRRAS
jgi:branched-chain amino acid aminotransferase